jgi:hypothetical protein
MQTVLTRVVKQEMLRMFKEETSPHDAKDGQGEAFTLGDSVHVQRVLGKYKQAPNCIFFAPLHIKEMRIHGKDFEALLRLFLNLPMALEAVGARARGAHVAGERHTCRGVHQRTCQRYAKKAGKEHRIDLDRNGAHA